LTLVANSRWPTTARRLGKLGSFAKPFPRLPDGRDKFATSVNIRVTSLKVASARS